MRRVCSATDFFPRRRRDQRPSGVDRSRTAKDACVGKRRPLRRCSLYGRASRCARVLDLPFTHDGLEPICKLRGRPTCWALFTLVAKRPRRRRRNSNWLLRRPLLIRLCGRGGQRRNYPVLTGRNGSSACKPPSHKQRVVATPAATPVGGTTAPVRSRAHWAISNKRTRDFRMRFCFLTGYWRTTSPDSNALLRRSSNQPRKKESMSEHSIRIALSTNQGITRLNE